MRKSFFKKEKDFFYPKQNSVFLSLPYSWFSVICQKDNCRHPILSENIFLILMFIGPRAHFVSFISFYFYFSILINICNCLYMHVKIVISCLKQFYFMELLTKNINNRILNTLWFRIINLWSFWKGVTWKFWLDPRFSRHSK